MRDNLNTIVVPTGIVQDLATLTTTFAQEYLEDEYLTENLRPIENPIPTGKGQISQVIKNEDPMLFSPIRASLNDYACADYAAMAEGPIDRSGYVVTIG
jgi:hypothetical protein